MEKLNTPFHSPIFQELQEFEKQLEKKQMGLRFFNFDNHVIKLLELRHATILLTAIRWYELEHHCWPENLYELVPEYLSKLPIDPNTGTDWIYTINDSQLTLAVQHENTQNIIVEMDLD